MTKGKTGIGSKVGRNKGRRTEAVVITPETTDPEPASKKDERKQITLRLDPDIHKALKIRALQEDTSIQAIINDLLTDYLY